MNYGNVCCHSVQNPLSSGLLSRNMKIKIHITIILFFFFVFFIYVEKLGLSRWGRNMGWECSRVGCNRDEVTGTGGEYIGRSLMICTSHQILIGWSIKKDKVGGTHGTYAGEERCIHGFGRETRGKEVNCKTKCRWEDNITMDLQEICWERGLDWSGSGHGDESSGTIKCGVFRD